MYVYVCMYVCMCVLAGTTCAANVLTDMEYRQVQGEGGEMRDERWQREVEG